MIETAPHLDTQNWDQPQNRLLGLVCHANQLGYALLSQPTPYTQAQLEEILKRLPPALHIKIRDMKNITIKALKKACQLSHIVDIPQDYFVPHLKWETLDSPRNIKDFISEIWKATRKPQGIHLDGDSQSRQESEWSATSWEAGGSGQTTFLWLQDLPSRPKRPPILVNSSKALLKD